MPFYFFAIKKKAFKEKALFLARWMKNPFRMGAVLPSSRVLCRKISQSIQAHPDMYVVELGGGTGQLTHEILETGISSKKLFVIEIDSILVDHLKVKFPHVQVCQGNATRIDAIIPSSLHGKVSTIISGLPLLSFSEELQRKIIEAAFAVLAPDGEFIQFTYSPFSSFSSKRYGLQKRRAGFVFRNIPPATIWAYKKKKEEL